jgi:hypothetical protein
MLFNFQRIHPAAELQIHPGVRGALSQRAIERALIYYLGKWTFRPVLQLLSPGRNCLDATNIRQNGPSGEIKSGKSLVSNNPRADCLLSHPALGLEEGDIQPRLSQEKCGVCPCRACSDNDDVLQTANLIFNFSARI